ncbi:MAG: DUF308 domain-containing protein [Bacteroidaceae bacterium]|nr:DUF308 domain-containing protein [Bacteroidaceae bacterium]
MRNLLSAFLRALCAIGIGFLLVMDPLSMTSVIVRFIGGVFVVLGVTQAISSLSGGGYEGALKRRIFPVVGLGSILLGVVLLLMPNAFVAFLMYILGFLLIFAGFGQFFGLVADRRIAPLRWWVFVMPILLVGAGFFILLKPLQSASLPFVILGVASLGYGISELFLAFRLMHFRHQQRQEYVEYEEVTEEE